MHTTPKILKQYTIPWVGGFKEVLGQTLFYITAINFTLIAITAYNTTLRVFILEWLPEFKLWMFFGILVTCVLLGMILEYKFITPSQYAFRSKQLFEHESTVMDKLVEMEATIARMAEELSGRGNDTTGTKQGASHKRRNE